MSKVFLSIGHGFSSKATQSALGVEWRFLGTSRQAGAAEVHWPADAKEAIAQATHILSWVPPGPDGDPIAPLVLDAHAPKLRWIGYASASSVYGDTDGAWIDDFAPDAPSTKRGHARVAAEASWSAAAQKHDVPFCALRIAGIYGPGRSTFDALRAGRAKRIVKPGQVFNRIHVEDLGRIAAAAAQMEISGPVIVADQRPAPLAEVTAFAADLMSIPCPPEVPFESADLSPTARSFYSENKRLRARRIVEDLGLTLRHPTYEHGLRAILAQSSPPLHSKG